jgi:hypothetical protein
LLKIPNLVESKYLLLSPDDDFFLPLGIQRCLQFLEENDQYTSAQGQRIYFREGKVIEWGPMYENYTGLDFWEDDVRERLLRMSCSMHFIYSVMRTEVFSKIISTLENTESKNPNSAFQVEYVFNYLLALFGKHKILPILYSARERHPVWHQNLSFSGWINDTQDQAAVNFRRSISRMYQSSMKLSDLDAQKLEQEITNYFVRRPKAKTIENLSLGRFKNLAKRFIRTFSKGFESGVLLRWRFSKLRPFFPLWRKSYWRYYFEIWKSGNVVNFYKDLSSFIQFLQRNKVSD